LIDLFNVRYLSEKYFLQVCKMIPGQNFRCEV